MTELISSANEMLESNDVHPLMAIGVFVAKFLAIHPFHDGNGRLSRVLTTLLLLKKGYAYVPYSSLESVIESNKEGYYLALRRTQGTLESNNPLWDPWLEFFLQSMHKQMSILRNKLERERVFEGDLPELSVRILELVREHGRVKTSEIELVTGESRSTIKLRLNELVQRGLLARYGKGPSTWYSIPKK
jgi:Fic family protein